MKKRLLSAFLAVMMVLTMAPVAFAVENPTETSGSVAQVGETGYATLADALSEWAASGGTLKLLQDGELTAKVTLNKVCTLDLNGQKLSTGVSQALYVNGGTLTIEDSSEDESGVYESTKSGQIYINAGSVTLNNGTVKGAGGTAYGVVNVRRFNNSFTMNGGAVECTGTMTNDVLDTTKGYAIVGLGTKKSNPNQVTINGGKVTSVGDAIYTKENAVRYTIGGNAQVGRITIVATSSGYPTHLAFTGNALIDGLTVTGKYLGSFTAENTVRFKTDVSDALVTTSYGCFAAEDGTYKVDQLTQDNAAAAVINDEGTTYYGTLAGAVQAVGARETVKLLKDCTSAYPVKVNNAAYGMTLDLNGHNITNTDTQSAAKALDLGFGGQDEYPTVSIINSSDTTATISAVTPVVATASQGAMAVDIGKNVTLNSTVDQRQMKLEGSAYVDVSGKTDAEVDALGDLWKTADNKLFGDFSYAARFSAGGDVTLVKDYTGLSGLTARNTCVVDFNGHTYNVQSNAESVLDILVDGVSVTLKNGTLTSSTEHTGIITNGNNSDINLTLQNFTLSVPNGRGIYFPSSGSVKIENSVINAKHFGVQVCAGSLTVSGDKTAITATGAPQAKVENDGPIDDGAAVSIVNRAGYKDLGKVQILGGAFAASNASKAVKAYSFNNTNKAEDAWNNAADTVSITGGYFTTDPSDYVTGGLTGVPSNRTDKYVWTVGKKSETKAEVATGEPTVDTSNVTTNTDADKKLLEATKTALSSTEVEGNGIATAAAVVANNNTVTADEKVVNQLNAKADNINATADNTNIVIQTYMDMTITGVDASSEKKTITVDIQPMYRTVATTADVKNGGEIVLEGDGSKAVNAVQIGNPQKLTVSGETTVSIQLPTGFVTDATAKIFVQHKGYEYEATVTKDTAGVYTATFTNPHGFSPFTISMTSQAVAQIGETKYTSLQDAVNAVAANGTIEIIGGTSPYTGTANKTFTVSNKTGAEITVNGQKIAKDGSYTFKYTPSSGGSSGGSSSGKTTYKVTTSAVNNGGVNASPSNAEKGATITITLSPDKGYKLDKLTVTDGSGKTVSTVKKSNTVYTFTMPASAVKVGVSYVKATETPSETKFNDVSANDWFASAVDYVTGKGMMNGTADNTFSPKANTTRGMVVTVLYRLENQPSTSAASFTDVASGAYYANAVAWANANGIVSGYGSGKFGPNDKVTREQLAAILYRYAQYKKYDVSGANSLDGYTDAQSVSSYAVPALQWANAAGVVTGKSGSKLDPKGNATRAEVAAMLMRFCENVK